LFGRYQHIDEKYPVTSTQCPRLELLYMSGLVFDSYIVCGKYLHDHIILLSEDDWAYKISLFPIFRYWPYLMKVYSRNALCALNLISTFLL